MQKYVLVRNHPNQTATVHLSICTHLGADPLAQSASAERLPFDDGFEAMVEASSSKQRFVCAHCLSKFRTIVTEW